MDKAARKFYDAERYRVRRALLEIRRGYPMTAKGNPHRVVRSDGAVFDSAEDAARSLGMASGTHISRVCKGHESRAGGYGWRYLESWEQPPRPGELKTVNAYADAEVYRDLMGRLTKGTCGTCKYYAKTGGRMVCRHGARTVDTDRGATCASWHRVMTPEEEALERGAAEAERKREEERAREKARALRMRCEEEQRRREEERARSWAFRSEVLGLQVELFVSAACRRYDMGPGNGPR